MYCTQCLREGMPVRLPTEKMINLRKEYARPACVVVGGESLCVGHLPPELRPDTQDRP